MRLPPSRADRVTGGATDTLLRDQQLVQRLDDLKSIITNWASKHGLWDDAGFRLPHVHRGEAPFSGELLYLWSAGDLASMFNGDHEL